MEHKISTLERAFQLARSGEHSSVEGIKRQLKAEGYDWNLPHGPHLNKQLRELIRAALPNVNETKSDGSN